MVRFGLPWPGSEVARKAEDAGIGAFCTGEFVDHDAYVAVAEMALSTENAQVGTAISYAFARTPMAHAMAARSLNALAPGRVFIGLGSGAFTINRDWCGVEADRPVARMADLTRAVRTWLDAENGEPVRYEGDFYRIKARVQAPVLGRVEVPILLAGFNSRMVETAAQVADGIVGHGLFTARWWDDIVRPAIERGLKGAERTSPLLEHGWLLTAVDDDDPERAVQDLRRMIAFYLTVKTYDQFAAHHGWQQQVTEIREAFAAGRIPEMTAAVTEDMVEAIGLAGSTSDVKAGLRRRKESLAADVVYLAPPSFLVSHRRKAAYARASLALVNNFEPFTPNPA